MVNLRKLKMGPVQSWLERRVSKWIWPSTSAAVLAARNNHILTVRVDDMFMLPGGVVEPGETLEEAAVRETKEETGVNVQSQGHIYELRQNGRGPLQVFGGKITGGSLRASKEGEPVMLPIDKVEDVRWRHDLDIPGMLMDLDLL
jgi:8-oxo-dGTP pyrophosphatase MutT (NUDIX family)